MRRLGGPPRPLAPWGGGGRTPGQGWRPREAALECGEGSQDALGHVTDGHTDESLVGVRLEARGDHAHLEGCPLPLALGAGLGPVGVAWSQGRTGNAWLPPDSTLAQVEQELSNNICVSRRHLPKG